MARQPQQQGLALAHIQHIKADMPRKALCSAQHRAKAQKQRPRQQQAASAASSSARPL